MTSLAHFPDLAATLERVAGRMTRIANTGLNETCPIGIIDFEKWEWPQGVGLYGLFRHYETTRNPAHLGRITGWFDRRLGEGLPSRNVNTTAPLLTLAHLQDVAPDAAQRALIGDWAQWVMRELPRTRADGFQHIVSGERNDQQVWSDTLFMTVLFLAKAGVLLQRPEYLDESIRQFLVHTQYLADKKTGLWFHGWTFDGNHNFANALWARGNCWVTAGIVDYLEVFPVPVGVKAYLSGVLQAQVESLATLQSDSGLWHTLLDDPTSYLESSATAGFAYGILKAARLGLVAPRYAEVGYKAVDGLLRRIDPDGTVNQVSYGTGMGRDLEHYRRIPICPMAYGQALTILLLAEAQRHER